MNHKYIFPVCGLSFTLFTGSFKKNWCTVDLQCYINFCYTAKWFSCIYVYIYLHLHTHIHIYTHTHTLFHILFPLWLIIGYWIYFPVLHSRTLLFIHSTYSIGLVKRIIWVFHRMLWKNPNELFGQHNSLYLLNPNPKLPVHISPNSPPPL